MINFIYSIKQVDYLKAHVKLINWNGESILICYSYRDVVYHSIPSVHRWTRIKGIRNITYLLSKLFQKKLNTYFYIKTNRVAIQITA
jgi:hypothetical protein